MSGNPLFFSSADSQHQHCFEYIQPETDGLTLPEQVIQQGQDGLSLFGKQC